MFIQLYAEINYTCELQTYMAKRATSFVSPTMTGGYDNDNFLLHLDKLS